MKQITLFALLLLFSVAGFAKDAKERVSKHVTTKGAFMSVTYGQPMKKGREIFGGLVPYGKVWRTGADEATQITFTRGCMFGGRQVTPGTYTLFTIPNKTEWTIILNSKLGQWGAFDYEKNKAQDYMSDGVGVVSTLAEPLEQFTIEVLDNGIKMSWDKTSVFVEAKPW
ncbi:MAG: DUF2911 domain-containing protein [Chitinophagia bacterium]|nr:DUF2911 domain-containing protein [Chitinophagia bacterium]